MARMKPEHVQRLYPAEEMQRAIQDVQNGTIHGDTLDILRDCVAELLAHRQTLEDVRNFVTVQAAKMARY